MRAKRSYIVRIFTLYYNNNSITDGTLQQERSDNVMFKFQDRYTCSSSTWSFAVTLWEVMSLAREKPFQHLSNDQVIQNAEHMYYGGELQVNVYLDNYLINHFSDSNNILLEDLAYYKLALRNEISYILHLFVHLLREYQI